jgi:hypothetical protein
MGLRQQQLGLFNTHVGDTCLMPFHACAGLSVGATREDQAHPPSR